MKTMTEQQWCDCDDMKQMVGAVRGTVGTRERFRARVLGSSELMVSDRKNRLFNVACCRRIWHLYRRPAVQAAILVGERFADGLADDVELRAALNAIHKERARVLHYSTQGEAVQAAGFTVTQPDPKWLFLAAHNMKIAVGSTVAEAERRAVQEREERASCDLVREILGNPFRQVVLEPVWLTESVCHLALAIYESLSFEDMPILADALEDAGCREARILDHCRKVPGPSPEGSAPVGHARGCWVLDLVLGRS
jgi:hypothetical protein